MMKRVLLYFSFVLIGGCGALPRNSTLCPETPTKALLRSEVESVLLSSDTTEMSGQLGINEQIGYEFKGIPDRKLSYKFTEFELCTWIVAPDLRFLTSAQVEISLTSGETTDVKQVDLPLHGSYIIQLYSPQESKAFNIRMSLGDLDVEEK